MEAYGRAMKGLRRYLNSFGSGKGKGRGEGVDLRVVMMCCAAFFCFELVRGEQEAALRHLRCGVEVLRQWEWKGQSPRCGGWEGERGQLADVFARMDLQASAFGDGLRRATGGKNFHGEDVIEVAGDMTVGEGDRGLDLQAAKYSLLLRRCFNLLVESAAQRSGNVGAIPKDMTNARRDLLKELKAWDEHLNALSSDAGARSHSSHLTSAIARSRFHSTLLRVLITHCLPLVSTASPPLPPPPGLDDKADDLLHLASAAMDESSNQNNAFTGQPKRHFCLHLGIVAPLFLLALKTSRPDVLAQCLGLLRRCRGRREGLYDADIVVRIIEEVLKQSGGDETASLLDRMGDDAALRLQEAVQSVVPAKEDRAGRVRGLCRLLALVG